MRLENSINRKTITPQAEQYQRLRGFRPDRTPTSSGNSSPFEQTETRFARSGLHSSGDYDSALGTGGLRRTAYRLVGSISSTAFPAVSLM
jgi:hypothetical protein